MSNPNQERRDAVDRFARRELSAAEERELAQQALDDPELFDELTSISLANAALEDVVRKPAVVWYRRPVFWAGCAAAAAALIIAVLLYPPRQNSLPVQRAAAETHQTAATRERPVLSYEETEGRPLLLSADLLRESDAAGDRPVFRGAGATGRSPRQNGSVVSVEDGTVSIDLGSLDGVSKGSSVAVYATRQSTQLIGRIRVSTAFRERSRGEIEAVSGGVQTGAAVRISDGVFLNALAMEVDALAISGDSRGALEAAEKAVQLAERPGIDAKARAAILHRLGVLEYRAGRNEASESHLGSATRDKGTANALNDLAVVLLLRGAEGDAKTALNQALASASANGIEAVESLNNLGVIAEMNGDRKTAETQYGLALARLDAVPGTHIMERRALQANLKRVKGNG